MKRKSVKMSPQWIDWTVTGNIKITAEDSEDCIIFNKVQMGVTVVINFDVLCHIPWLNTTNIQ